MVQRWDILFGIVSALTKSRSVVSFWPGRSLCSARCGAGLAARGESAVTQKGGTATAFRSTSLLDAKHFDENRATIH